MATRASMAALIARLRLLVNDPVGASQIWSDDQLQDWLDGQRTDVVRAALYYNWAIVAGANAVLNYFAETGDWESDAALSDVEGTTLTPGAVNLLTGRWTFAAHQAPPVYLTGQTYDLYAAAADVLEARAGQLAGAYDFTADGATYHRSQQAAGLLALARQYRGRSRPRMIQMVRDDAN